MSSEARPAFYALAPGGWRDYVTLLHPPYTLWHLSYVVIGAALAPRTDWRTLGLTLVAFALALGIGAHALDELHGRPLETRIPDTVLLTLALVSIAGAVGLGIAVAVEQTLWLLLFVAIGGFLVVAYNLELFDGRFHSDLWFGLAWGGFPVLTAAFAVGGQIRADVALAAVFAVLLSLAQRRLSARVREVRRRVTAVNGTIVYRDGRSVSLDAAALTRVPELALRLLAAAIVVLAVSLVVHRLV